ncbi:hypothetical protein SAMN04487896_5867 [Paenibacillus sp. ov031]|nr:hypothetical protein SAMN04487896_5867 [Paenibacillus sp. ov031]
MTNKILRSINCITGRYSGDIKTVTTPVEAYVSLSSDRGSTPLASIRVSKNHQPVVLVGGFSVFNIITLTIIKTEVVKTFGDRKQLQEILKKVNQHARSKPKVLSLDSSIF